MTETVERVLAQFKNESGEIFGSPLDLPINVDSRKLSILFNAIYNSDKESVPYSFFLEETEIRDSLKKTIEESADSKNWSSEKIVYITFAPQAVFRVRPVTRCSASLPGHAEAVISASFSPDGSSLASGSGDTTVRFWDVTTQTPHHTARGHRNWVLVISWAPNGLKLASACKNGEIIVWEAKSGKQIGSTLKGHKQWINALSWEPLHRDGDCRRLASASKDATIRIWDTILGQSLIILCGHSASITCLKWGGTGLIYSGSQDRTLRVWRDSDGVLCRTLEGHGHWLNTLALSTDYVMRTGAFEPAKGVKQNSIDDLAQVALERYNKARGEKERLVSGSDDFTLFLWEPEDAKKHVARMTGHQQLINDVKFSPDTRIIASASFDKSIKLWDGKTGKYITSLRGHVQAVYQIAWSADTRLLVSGSADSTVKVWDMSTRKLLQDLPGHADEVYAIDWSPDGELVASGGKDKLLKIWRT
ncbi:notchless protein homolog 1-like isoform X2 [Panonychus citri]|uniref:notchless protein homolog 1-like isoform X2 n=1 Tax=Panonychus citri TaxID=50023 RepID=UPI002307767F|nr:notchless protein homolog 1-like isoform X2 [Panonychus citri]